MNIARLEQLKAHILAEPLRLEMRDWIVMLPRSGGFVG